MVDPLTEALNLSKSIYDYVLFIRRHLHENPELSMQETETMQFVCRELEQMGIPYERVIDGGIIGTIDTKKPGRTLILRADLDALPVQEAKTNLKFQKVVRSQVEGIAHTCGHDAHTAMLLGTAKLLQERKDQLKGKILLVFEQGEEVGGGVRNLTKRLIEIGADGVWGIHLKNDLASGKISVEKGPRMAAPLPFEVVIRGKGGHGSRPDLANSPIDCYVDLHSRMTQLSMQSLNPQEPLTFSVGSLQAGEAANVIPETLRFAGTFRFLHLAQGKKVAQLFKRLLADVTELHGCTYEFILEPQAKELFVYNNEYCAELAEKAVKKALGIEALQTLPAWMASEPFAFYQAFFPGVFAFLGIQNEAKGTGADHHNAHFDVDEDVLQLGVAASFQYTVDFLRAEEVIPFKQKYKHVDELTFT